MRLLGADRCRLDLLWVSGKLSYWYNENKHGHQNARYARTAVCAAGDVAMGIERSVSFFHQFFLTATFPDIYPYLYLSVW